MTDLPQHNFVVRPKGGGPPVVSTITGIPDEAQARERASAGGAHEVVGVGKDYGDAKQQSKPAVPGAAAGTPAVVQGAGQPAVK